MTKSKLPTPTASAFYVVSHSGTELDKDQDQLTEYLSPVENPPIDLEIKTEDKSVPLTIKVSQENTRSNIAWTFTIFFLAIVLANSFIPFIANVIRPDSVTNPLETSRELTTMIASILGGPFGFIVGFYFKQNSDNH